MISGSFDPPRPRNLFCTHTRSSWNHKSAWIRFFNLIRFLIQQTAPHITVNFLSSIRRTKRVLFRFFKLRMHRVSSVWRNTMHRMVKCLIKPLSMFYSCPMPSALYFFPKGDFISCYFVIPIFDPWRLNHSKIDDFRSDRKLVSNPFFRSFGSFVRCSCHYNVVVPLS